MKNTCLLLTLLFSVFAHAQIGKRFPSERKLVKDPVTGIMLTFVTSKPFGDSKIYQTHTQWTADGQWLIFRSGRARNEAMAVNENTGDIVQGPKVVTRVCFVLHANQ
jgi:oligogalacturonide lyase